MTRRQRRLPIELTEYYTNGVKVSILEFSSGSISVCIESEAMEYCIGKMSEYARIYLSRDKDRYMYIAWNKPLRTVLRCTVQDLVAEEDCEEIPASSRKGRMLIRELAEIAELMLDRACSLKVEKRGM